MNRQAWWNTLLIKYQNYWSAGEDFGEYLINLITNSEELERLQLIDFLTQIALNQTKGHQVALFVLEKHCNSKNLELLYQKAKYLELDNPILPYYLRVIALNGQEKHKDLLESFFFSIELNIAHSFVRWATFPNYPDVFVKAYTQYLTKTNYQEWIGTAVTQSFFHNPNALVLVKECLQIDYPFTWLQLKKDLQTQLKENYLEENLKFEINRIISKPDRSMATYLKICFKNLLN
jgi:hypothetical protein